MDKVLIKRVLSKMKKAKKKEKKSNISSLIIDENARSFHNESKPVLTTIMNFTSNKNFKRTINICVKTFEAAKKYGEKPSIIAGLWAVFEVGNTIFDEFEMLTYDYFSQGNWVSIFNPYFYETVYRCLTDFEFYTVSTSDEERAIQVFDFFGAELGVYLNSKTKTVGSLYAKKDKVDFVNAKMRELLWKKFKNENIVISTAKIPDYDMDMIVFSVDNQIEPISSDEANRYSAYLQKCIDANVNRSMLFIGSPGTGKSTLVKTIVKNLNLRSLRIRVDEVDSFSIDTMMDVVSIFRPDAIIIDDFDRVSSQSSMLQVLEHLKKTVKLILFTVNNKEYLDNAILRPGRIDEFVYVEKLSENAVRTILGKEHAAVFESVKLWPVAFINEYINRCKFMSSAEAMRAMRELALRVKEIRTISMNDPEETYENLVVQCDEADEKMVS